MRPNRARPSSRSTSGRCGEQTSCTLRDRSCGVGDRVCSGDFGAASHRAVEAEGQTGQRHGHRRTHYQAGAFHRWFFGDNYRDLWTTPIRVPVFDWHSFAGGLHPTKEGGGNQTKSLRFETAEGDEYVFRLVDKTVRAPEQLKGTPVAWLIQDVAVSAQHPGGGAVTARLVKASGVLHPTPMLVAMPDDSALGKFHDDFAGKLGRSRNIRTSRTRGPVSAARRRSSTARS